jgi:hypothetical protein
LLTAVQTLLFAAKQDETQIVLGRVRRQDAANLENARRAAAVIVGTRCGCCDAARRIH